jgi:hypothetical protein
MITAGGRAKRRVASPCDTPARLCSATFAQHNRAKAIANLLIAVYLSRNSNLFLLVLVNPGADNYPALAVLLFYDWNEDSLVDAAPAQNRQYND